MRKYYSIVFCCDRGYGSYLIVALEGLLKHISSHKNYEIIVIDCGLDNETIQSIKNRLVNTSNVTLKLQNFDELYQTQKDIYYANSYISAAAYARFFLGNLTDNPLILYLDVDICIECDVADIIDTQDPKDKLLSAAPDIGMEICRRYEKGWIAYFKNVIQVNYGSTEHYCNSGVLVINRKQWVAQNIEAKLLAFLNSDKKFHFFDQDVLNIVSFGQIKYLDFRFNFMASEYKKHKTYDDAHLNDILLKYDKAALQTGLLIHYTTGHKPWNSSQTQFSAHWWQICRTTSIYEKCLVNLMQYKNIGKRQITFLGMPLFQVKQTSHTYKFYFLKINIVSWKIKGNNKIYYILKLPFLKTTKI